MSTSGSPCPTTLTKRDTSRIDIMVPDLTRSALSVVMGHQLPSDTTSGLGDDRTVGCLRGLEGMLAEDDRDRVDGGVHGLDPPQVGLDDFLTGGLPRPDRFDQVPGAQAPQLGHRGEAHAYRLSCRLPRRRTVVAVVATTTALSAPVAQRFGFFVAGCLPNDSGGANSRWTAVVPTPGTWLKTTRLVPSPNLERSIRKTDGSWSSSGWRGAPRFSAGIGLRARSLSCPRRTKTSAPRTNHFCTSRSEPGNEYQPQRSLQCSG